MVTVSTTCRNRVEPGYNDIGLYVSPVESDILWYQLIRHC
jgi:hypothetical protein